MPITDSTRETLDLPSPAFFDLPFDPGAVDLLADAVAAWLCSDDLRWLVRNVPGRRDPGGPVEPLEWPRELDDPRQTAFGGRPLLTAVVDALGGICDWAHPGTVWDSRQNGERPLRVDRPGPAPGVAVAAVAERAAALGLCSRGRLRTRPGTLVVLGGRRMAPLNRARAAARAIRAESLDPAQVILLSGQRSLDRGERESPEVRAYAPGARSEADLMRAAAQSAFGVDPLRVDDGDERRAGAVRLVEAPAPAGALRASTYDTLRTIAGDPAIDPSTPVALVTSPTCRPFQYLEAARALGLGAGIRFELLAHPRAWAAAPGSQLAAPQVYLQEVRSAIQAAGRLSTALSGAAAARSVAPPAALA